MEVVFAVISLIGIAMSVLDAVGSSKSNSLANVDAQLLRNLKKEVESANSIDTAQLSRLNSIVQSIYSMRSQLDPRLIDKLDNAISTYNDAIAQTSKNIASRQSKYETAAASIPTRNQGMVGLTEKSLQDKLSETKKKIEAANKTKSETGKDPLSESTRKSYQNNISNWENLITPQVESTTKISNT